MSQVFHDDIRLILLRPCASGILLDDVVARPVTDRIGEPCSKFVAVPVVRDFRGNPLEVFNERLSEVGYEFDLFGLSHFQAFR